MESLINNKKIIYILIYLVFFLAGDVLFSNFIYKKKIQHNCYKNMKNFFQLQKNCYAKEKWVRNVNSYDVYTDENGFRFSGKKKEIENDVKIAAFFGDSFTYGMGLDYNKTFVGLIENEKKEFNILNLGVPGYSPTVFNYQLKQIIQNGIIPSKIFFVLDISDVSEEASQWDIKDGYDQPVQINQAIGKDQNIEEEEKSFIDENFKGSRFIARSVNNFFRSFRLYLSSFKKKPEKAGYSGWGNFLYMDLNETDKNLWEPFGFDEGINKIKKNSKEIANLAKSVNAELYIVIYPWPDSLEYGQNKFNWENFSQDLCTYAGCTKLINFFPEFSDIKKKYNNWLTKIYIGGDLHLTEYGQKIIANKLLQEAFIK
tara:strand:- start:238 stop:1350 length:1113 start_codon:yes stop_codon:yes gene_type:complete